ncbi:CPBP family intramembrane metalloprotease, partial [bacterium]|nr:CPBP family intramembrane metalloprotease [bacterium]
MNKLSVKDSAFAFVVASLLCQIFAGVFLVIAIAICSSCGLNINTDWFKNNCWGYLLTSIIFNISLFLIFLYFKRKKEEKIIKKPKFKKILTYILVAVISFFMLYPAINLFEILLTNWGVKSSDPPILNTTTDFIVSIFSMAVLPAIFEELVFRGIIFTGLKQKGKTFAILI